MIKNFKVKNTWEMQEAQDRFFELVSKAEKEEYQTITKNTLPVAVIVSKEIFEKTKTSTNNLLEFFKESPCQNIDL